jgi:hypothetical protein
VSISSWSQQRDLPEPRLCLLKDGIQFLIVQAFNEFDDGVVERDRGIPSHSLEFLKQRTE